jgi:hypothetical protein
MEGGAQRDSVGARLDLFVASLLAVGVAFGFVAASIYSTAVQIEVAPGREREETTPLRSSSLTM